MILVESVACWFLSYYKRMVLNIRQRYGGVARFIFVSGWI